MPPWKKPSTARGSYPRRGTHARNASSSVKARTTSGPSASGRAAGNSCWSTRRNRARAAAAGCAAAGPPSLSRSKCAVRARAQPRASVPAAGVTAPAATRLTVAAPAIASGENPVTAGPLES
ncbi:MAG: hypothetical protein DMF82_08980 [Acidobacteria bacterium]|nr:MAG: hypothetical protein DMF82_08980 [Acidobacteriota bacterium]